jgi:riboflavin biosynthesis pyrimidine reductase
MICYQCKLELPYDDHQIMPIDSVQQLYPQPARELPLRGLYLAHDLRQFSTTTTPLVYTNFISSLDGRIALPCSADGQLGVPAALANQRDWRLFQELLAQADVLISSGRYLRDYAKNQAQDILCPHKHPDYADLVAWRQSRNLPPAPAVAVLSRSLDFSVPADFLNGQRTLIVFTGASANSDRRQALTDAGITVLSAGLSQDVDSEWAVNILAERGYRTIYAVAGPEVFHALLTRRMVNRLYLTLSHRLLGGQPYASMVTGPGLVPPDDFCLHSLYYDYSPHSAATNMAGQSFYCFHK